MNLNFHLTTPWGLIDPKPLNNPTEPPNVQAHTATWHLAANEPHHIEATFWVPSLIGIGAGAIALLCTLGYTLKYKRLP
ncbi:MAG: DUF3153 domain-containing protein [Phormidesmis sp.]